MNKFLKENWFKIGVLIVLAGAAHIYWTTSQSSKTNEAPIVLSPYHLKEGWSVSFPAAPERTQANNDTIFYDVYAADGLRYLIGFIDTGGKKMALYQLTNIAQQGNASTEFITSGVLPATNEPFVETWSTLTTEDGLWLSRSSTFVLDNKLILISVSGNINNPKTKIESAFNNFLSSIEYLGY